MIECRLNNETYHYEITYDENFQIHYTGGDAFIVNHAETEKYNNANALIAQIEDYFTARGGTCIVSSDENES